MVVTSKDTKTFHISRCPDSIFKQVLMWTLWWDLRRILTGNHVLKTRYIPYFTILSTPLECQFGATSLNIGCQCRQVSVRPDSGAPCLHRVKHKLTSAWHRHISGIPRSQSRWRIENSLFAFLSQTGNVVFEIGKRHSFMAFVVNQNQGWPGFTKRYATEMVAWLVIRLGSKLILSLPKFFWLSFCKEGRGPLYQTKVQILPF